MNLHLWRWFVLVIAFMAGVHVVRGQTAPAATAATAATAPERRFEKEVKAYEAADWLAAPPKGAILLVGDSQFFRWKTVAEDLPGYTVINRGIDSLQMSDLLYFAERLVVAYRPRLIVTHIGGNDIHNKRTPEELLGDFKAFVGKVRAAQPEVPIVFSSMTPGPARMDEAEARKKANALIKEYAATQKKISFVNLWDAMLTAEGKPREDIWVEDRVHPNHEGYLIRVTLTLPFLGEPDVKLPATRPAATRAATVPE